jgi:predicted porin
LGSFLDKSIRPIVSFHSDNESENTEKRTYLAIGSKFIFGDFDVDIDYLANQKSYKTWTAGASKDLSSLVLSVRYKLSSSIHFILKGDSSVDKVATSASTSPEFGDIKYTQVAATAEYYPYTDTKFRYHLALAQKTTKPVTGEDLSEQKIIAGIRLVHDFLK